MSIRTIDASQQKAARVAGIAFLITMAAVIFANFAIHERLIVAGNAAETARNIVAHERLFRIGLACDLIYCAGLVVLLTALYVILEPVSRGVALLAALSRLVYALTWVLMTLNGFYVLRLLSGADYTRALDADRVYALARLFLSTRFEQYYVGLLFFGLASAICGYLWFKSGYIPRPFAAFGLISSIWCVACTLVFLIFPDFTKVVNLWWFDSPMGVFEIALSFWLLFKGLRPAVVPNGLTPRS
jgi:hypothetical protein